MAWLQNDIAKAPLFLGMSITKIASFIVSEIFEMEA
jgi:hypothetical protein